MIALRLMVALGIAALALTGCDDGVGDGPLTVSAIGEPLTPRTRERWPLDMPARALVDATAQGLVRFDAGAQVEPGLAERWIVIDGGRSYIFRLRAARWTDGTPVDATQVARLLARAIRRGGDNPLAPYLSAVERVVAMTPEVVEVRLSRPRPDLLKLFAQPEMALVRGTAATGTGPLRAVDAGQATLLRPLPDPDADPGDTPVLRGAGDVRLIGERAALAILRFAHGRADLVVGGDFGNRPLLATVDLPADTLRVDPAVGLFGFAITRRDGFLANPAHRAAVAAAMDRAAITAAVAPGWEPVERLLPDGLDSARPPYVAAWTLLTLAQRRAAARTLVARWAQPVMLRVAMPDGPGAIRLFGAVAASLRSVGIAAERVAAGAGNVAGADLTLVDAVAPYDNARWYLAAACRPCGEQARDRLEAARLAPTLGERAERTAEADAAIGEDVSFIPLARPMRWSLVSPAASAFTANARAAHPLNRLRAEPN